MCAQAYPIEPTLPLFQREVSERLSPTALELVLARADVFVEGGTASGSSARGAFYGSAMLTLDLTRCADRLRPPHDDEMARRLCAALDHDARAKSAVTARALEVAQARLSLPENIVAGALRCRVEGGKLLIDVELEAKRAAP